MKIETAVQVSSDLVCNVSHSGAKRIHQLKILLVICEYVAQVRISPTHHREPPHATFSLSCQPSYWEDAKLKRL